MIDIIFTVFKMFVIGIGFALLVITLKNENENNKANR